MKPKRPFSLRARVFSFKHAFRGLKDVLRTEHNARLHLAITAAVLSLAWYLDLEGTPFALVVLAMVSVWVAEVFNTVAEIVIDVFAPREFRPAKRIKDIAAAGVLIASAGAVVIGLLILGPPLWEKVVNYLPHPRGVEFLQTYLSLTQ